MIPKYLKRFDKYLVPGIILFFLVFRFQMASFRTSYQLSLLYLVSAIFSIFLINKKHIYPALFVLLCTFSSYYPVCSLTSVNSLRFVLIGVFAYYILTTIDIDKEYFYNTLCIYCLTHISFLILRYAGIEAYLIYGLTAENIGIGLTANPNESSMLIALCSPAFFRKKWCYVIPLIFIGFYLSKSVGGVLSFSLIISSFFLMTSQKFLGLLIPSLILIIAYNLKSPDITNRIDVWIAAIKYFFEENILFGFGLGHWEYISKRYLSESYNGVYFHRAHNTFIQCFFELGALFIPIVIGYSYHLIKRSIKDHIFIYALIAIFISCSVNSAFRINALNGFIILLWLSIIIKDNRPTHQ